jgi:hypothetical protein
MESALLLRARPWRGGLTHLKSQQQLKILAEFTQEV